MISKKINAATTFSNGIFFRSNFTPEFGVYSYYDEDGEIRTKRCHEYELLEFENYDFFTIFCVRIMVKSDPGICRQ